MGGAFFDLMPEAIEQGGSLFANFFCLIIGFCFFFILEQFIGWHHHHQTRHPEIASFSYLILISDGLHNFIDGLIIAGAFLASFPVGVVTTLVVVIHEIPQEIGDFGVLVYGGLKRATALFLNFLSGLVAVFGGIIGFFIFEKISGGVFFLFGLCRRHIFVYFSF